MSDVEALPAGTLPLEAAPGEAAPGLPLTVARVAGLAALGMPPPAEPPPAEPTAPPSQADLEALLFVAERPLSRHEIGSLTGLDADAVDHLLGDLEVALRPRGIRLLSSGERVQLVTAPESGGLIARYLGADSVRLSPAALETLAIVAYRQPVTRGTIERIRGVDSDHVVRGLLHRRLLVEQGRAETPGRPIMYATSIEFLERFGLTSLDDLPPLEAEVAERLIEAEAAAGDGAAGDGAAEEGIAVGGTGERGTAEEGTSAEGTLAAATTDGSDPARLAADRPRGEGEAVTDGADAVSPAVDRPAAERAAADEAAVGDA